MTTIDPQDIARRATRDLRLARTRRRPQSPASPEDHADRHEALRDRGRDGSHSEDSPPQGTIHTTDQVVAQAARLGWTVGITAADLVGAQCGAVIGLHPRDDAVALRTRRWPGVWFGTIEDSAAHQRAMDSRSVRPVRSHGRLAAHVRPPRPARHLPGLRHPRPDDHPHQRSPVQRLPEVRMERRGRIGLRRLLGPRPRHRRAEPGHPLLRRAALRRASTTTSSSWPSRRSTSPAPSPG